MTMKQPTQQQQLDKLIRVSSVIALIERKPTSSEIFEKYLENAISFEPHQDAFENLPTWQYIYDVLFSGESKQWVKYDEEKDTLTLVMKELPELILPSHEIVNDCDLIEQLSTLQLASAFKKTGRRSIKNVKSKVNELIRKQVNTSKTNASTPQNIQFGTLDEGSQALPKSQPTVNQPASPSPSASVNVTNVPNASDVILVNTPALAQQFLTHMSQHNIKLIGFDCEGVQLGINGFLTLVQISAHNIQFLFDMKLKDPTIIETVKKIMEDSTILKVIHDCDNDLCGLYKDFGINVVSVMDTSILYRVIHTESRKNIAFNDLCTLYKVPGNPFKHLGKKLHKTRSWGKELTPDMLNYAAGDVRTLIQLSIAMTPTLEEDAKKVFAQVDLEVKKAWSYIIARIQKKQNPTVENLEKELIEEATAKQRDVAILPESDFNVTIINQIDSFLDLFSETVKQKLQNTAREDAMNLIEVAMDKGRPYELFYYHKKESHTDDSFTVAQEDIDYVVNKLSFGTDNRAGIDGSLHRISAMVNRTQQIIGLTLRVGRAVMGRSKVFQDLIEQGKSILLLGKPGSGKTTFIRDFAKTLSDSRRVVVVDTSCEIGGFGDIPHVAIGKARRMQVADIRRQQEVMIQAVQNHTPEVIVIDEIGTRDEVSTARTIAQRGVILCGSAHGDMHSILKNPILCDLLGGVESVIMSDRNAKDGEKMRLQLKADPVFDVVIQLPDDNACNEWKIYTNLRQTVMNILAKRPFNMEVRKLVDNKVVTSIVLVE